MIKGKILLVSSLILLSSLFFISLFSKENENINNQIELNSFQYKVPIDGNLGVLDYELTLENAINKFSSNIVIGEIVNFEPSYISNNSYLYSVKVSENFLGDVQTDIIKIESHKLHLEVGKRYLLFLNDYDSVFYPEKFYQTIDEFILKVDEADTLYRLEDPENKIFIKPFKEEEFNNVAYLEKYINEIKHDNYFGKNPDKPAKQKANSIEELIDSSDHIVEIRVKNFIEGGNETVSAIEFDTKTVYKGNSSEPFIIVPNDSVKIGEDYLLFLVDKGTIVELTAREGSIINVNSSEYMEIKKDLEKIKE